MKKRNKKHNPLKRAITMATLGTSDMLLVFVGGKKATHAFSKKTLSPDYIGPSIAESIATLAFKWHVYLAVLCRRQDGQEYIQSEGLNFDAPYTRSTIESMLNDRHNALIESCNTQHVLNIGWIASTVPYDFTDEVASELFAKQDGWEYLAEWERLPEQNNFKLISNKC